MKPEVVSNAGIYKLTWPEHDIAIRLDRLHDRSEAVSAEVSIKSSLPGQPSHLHQARLNLTSTTARKTLAAFLTERYGASAPWGDILEQMCVLVLEHYRTGEPPVELGKLPRREALRYRVNPLLLEGQANMIYGAGQTGKSMMADYLAVLVDSPLNQNGLEAEPGNICIIDYETDEEEVAERVRMLQAGAGVETPTNIIYRYGRLPFADDIEQIQRIVVEHDIDLVIVDSLGMAAGGDQDKSTDLIRYFQALRTLKCTSLTIDHVNKEGKLYGNVYKFNEARNIWECKASAEPGTDILDIGLYHRKMNNGRLLKPLGFRFSFTGTQCVVSKQAVKDIPVLAAAMPLRLQLRDVLSRGALTTKQIYEELPVGDDGKRTTEESIRTVLYRWGRGERPDFVRTYLEGQREQAWGLFTSSGVT